MTVVLRRSVLTLLSVGLGAALLTAAVPLRPYAAERSAFSRYCAAVPDAELCRVGGHDDFEGPAGRAPDPAYWRAEVGGGGWGNGELQTYTDAADNVALDGQGRLALTARRVVAPDGSVGYTSARLTTRGNASFVYGTLTARIRVPQGLGIWPAFWLLGDDLVDVGYPESGEIDIFEMPDTASVLHSTVHGPRERDGVGEKYTYGTNVNFSPALSEGFHDYRVEKRPGSISTFVDDRLVGTITPGDLGPGERWVFDKPVHLILNVAVGGSFASAPSDPSAFPATMLVDWVDLRP